MISPRKLPVKKTLLPIFLFLILYSSCPGVAVLAQPVSASTATSTASSERTQPLQSPQPEIPPTPRSKLEIIQYILLPFAIGASIWLILRLEKMEQEEVKENKEE